MGKTLQEYHCVQRALDKRSSAGQPFERPTVAMQGWDYVRAALNPFSIASRKKVPAATGPGRRIVFAVDSSPYRCERRFMSRLASRPCASGVVVFRRDDEGLLPSLGAFAGAARRRCTSD